MHKQSHSSRVRMEVSKHCPFFIFKFIESSDDANESILHASGQSYIHEKIFGLKLDGMKPSTKAISVHRIDSVCESRASRHAIWPMNSERRIFLSRTGYSYVKNEIFV